MITEVYESTAFVYDGSLEGLLTAIFRAYEQKIVPQDIVRTENLQARLGQHIIEVVPDEKLALRVQKGICRRCGPVVFEAVKSTSLSGDENVGTIIYQFLRYALAKDTPADCTGCRRKMKCGGLCTKTRARSAIDEVTHPAVEPFIKANRAVHNERHLMMQFIRFEQLEGNLWFARCSPKASIIPLIMDWFVGRFNIQPFLIYDDVHNMAGVYEGKDWYLVKTDTLTLPNRSDDEVLMQQAWKRFYHTIAVESRYNPELRRQLMPKRFWGNMAEMKEDIPSKTQAISGFNSPNLFRPHTLIPSNGKGPLTLPE